MIAVLNGLELEKRIILENLGNAQITRNAQGTAYRRQYVEYQNGEPLIQEDLSTPYRLVFDPTHPDAMEEGPAQGYVEYPNVDLAQ